VKIPLHVGRSRALRGVLTIQIADVQNNVPVDDSKFSKPAAPPAAEPPIVADATGAPEHGRLIAQVCLGGLRNGGCRGGEAFAPRV
jgi:hypothetical protein